MLKFRKYLIVEVDMTEIETRTLERDDDEPESKRERKEGAILIQLKDESGNDCGDPIEVPSLINVDQLAQLTNSLLNNQENEKYAFYVDDTEIKSSLENTIEETKVCFQILRAVFAVWTNHETIKCCGTSKFELLLKLLF